VNVVTVLENGKRVFSQAKTLLPTYDIFDEARYFEPAAENKLWDCDGTKIALAICEDLWGNDTSFGRKLYGRDPIDCYKALKPDVLLSISASPYEWGKNLRREELHGEVARIVGAPLLYVNQVGANDEILFDGASFVLDREGKLMGRLPVFANSFAVITVEKGKAPRIEEPTPAKREDALPETIEILHRALVVGIRDYFQRTGFKTAILGLSGGVDSALVAALAVEALGAKNVVGVAMPSQYSSSHSLEDAEQLARNLGIQLEVRPIKFLYSQAMREMGEIRGPLIEVAAENLQSRLRGMILMALSNHLGALVLTTGNKSELAMGYCTQYGDMVGALAPIGDLFKTRVYELSRHINKVRGNPIPERTLTKEPSAELRPNQKDSDSLPPYEVLDPILEAYIEKGVAASELLKNGAQGSARVAEIVRKVEVNEFKRRQAAPALKISGKAFGIGRRIPIARTWDPVDS
jgi:NAD+ synthetase